MRICVWTSFTFKEVEVSEYCLACKNKMDLTKSVAFL